MADLLDELLIDLATETDRLRTAVSDLDGSADGGWATPTPAAGWTVATQVAHLLWTDEVATHAARAHTEAGQQAWDAVVLGALEDPDGYVDARAHEIAALAPVALVARWGAARTGLTEALRAVPPGTRMPWFGPPMSPTSMATARFMETWAHGQDVYDALGIVTAPSDRIRHVAHLGVRTRGFSFASHGQEPPAAEVRVELEAPSGARWTWGPDDAPERVTGSAIDFCLLVTQRIHRADTDLVADGPGADRWLDLAQAFAGAPGGGRAPR